jgi:CheY-like chemotaxis protein
MIEYKILLVEDDEIDVMNITRLFQGLSIPDEAIVVASNGEEAIDIIKNVLKNEKFLVVLDLNMPKMNGIEFLKEIRSNECYRSIPIVVLTTSSNEKDIINSYKYNVSGFLTKPMLPEEFKKLVFNLIKYWSMCKFPLIGEQSD